MAERLHFGKGDLLAYGVVVVLAVAILLAFLPNGQPGAYAQVFLNGQAVKTVSLTEDQTFSVDGKYHNEITVSQGKIAFTASDCPGQDCVHSGSIHTAGRSLVCLPNGVEIRVVSQEADVDFVVG